MFFILKVIETKPFKLNFTTIHLKYGKNNRCKSKWTFIACKHV